MTQEQFTHFFSSSLSQRIACACVTVCGLMIVWTLWNLTEIFITDIPASPAAVSVVPITPWVDEIASAHIFGSSEDALSLPETTLNLTLTGVISGANGSALIAVTGEQPQVFHVGDTVPGGRAVIIKIAPTFIELDDNGQLSQLSLPQGESIFSPPSGGLF